MAVFHLILAPAAKIVEFLKKVIAQQFLDLHKLIELGKRR